MKEWLLKRWTWVVGGVAFLAGLFTIFSNRKLRAKISVMEGREEDARLDEKQKAKEAEVKKLDGEIKEIQDKIKEIDDEKDINKLADHFNTRK